MNRFITQRANSTLSVPSLLIGAAIWGVIWYPYRLLQTSGISGTTATLDAYLIATLLFIGLFVERIGEIRKHPKDILLLSTAVAWTNLSYVLAIIDGEVVRVMLLFYLSPLWTLLLAHFFSHEKIGPKGVFIIALSLIGALVMLGDLHRLPLPKNHAEWLALSSGIGFSITNLLSHHAPHISVIMKSVSAWIGMIIISLVVIIYQGHGYPDLAVMTTYQWTLIFVITALLILATFLVVYGILHVPVTKASVLFMFELVVASLASFALTDEVMTLKEWVGGTLIVIAALIAAFNHEEVKTD
jgi:drug/metabolite transporter (DMT)-like permease